MIMALMTPLYGTLCLLLVSAIVATIYRCGLDVAFTDPRLVLIIRIWTAIITTIFVAFLLKIKCDKYFAGLVYYNPQKRIIFFMVECSLIVNVFTATLLFRPDEESISLIIITLLIVSTNVIIFLTALFMLVGFDILEDSKIQSNCQVIENMYRSLLSEKAEVMMEIDCISGKILNYFLKGQKQDGLVGTTYEKVTQTIIEKLHGDDRLEYLNQINLDHLKHCLNNNIHSWSYEYRLRTDTDDYEWYNDHIRVDQDLDSIKAIIVTSNIQQQKNLMYNASVDDLTGIFNRKSTEELINSYINLNHNGVLFLIDIDNFKAINDTLGHTTGDKVLKDIAQKLTTIFRSTDIIGRLGGDEFIVFIKSDIDVHSKATQLCNSVISTYSDGRNDVTISASVGICMVTQELNTFNKLYEMADTMLYASKDQGKNTFNVAS
ncbi:MAG: hypothetical protein BEN19_01250 [Epulopiscium sp. Nuni2H_MBin003]|nr:MAG: hypothetical protein BEN19_01250 [Epulopiscium sp. Nuni2H_MBin003]